jgi:glycosyl transferase family 25
LPGHDGSTVPHGPDLSRTGHAPPAADNLLRCYVLNLARSADRRAHMINELRNFGVAYDFIEAVDGRDLDASDPRLVSPSLTAEPGFSPGVAACAMSHLKAYRVAVEHGTSVALVMEDDIVHRPNLDAVARQIATQMRGAEVVLLNYYTTAPPGRLSSQDLTELAGLTSLLFPVTLRNLTSATAYLITREACQRMVEAMVPVRAHSDDWHKFYEDGALDRVRCAVPRLVSINYRDFRSTIQPSKRSGRQERARNTVTRYRVPPLYQVRLARRWHRRRQRKHFILVDEPSEQLLRAHTPGGDTQAGYGDGAPTVA